MMNIAVVLNMLRHQDVEMAPPLGPPKSHMSSSPVFVAEDQKYPKSVSIDL